MEQSNLHTVWIGEADRIASFHAVEDYIRRSFDCRESFLLYLQSLQQKGFRFQ